MMTLEELRDYLTALGAKFTLWETEPPWPPEADDSCDRVTRFGFTVCWHKTNAFECPTEDELA